MRGAAQVTHSCAPITTTWGDAPPSTSTSCSEAYDTMGLIGILLGLALLIWLALRGWSMLLLAPAAALLAAAFALEPLLANWTQTFMGSAAAFLAQFLTIAAACLPSRIS